MGKLFRKIVFRGLPEGIAQFSTPVTTLCMNHTLMAAYGDIGISAFAIISYLSSFTMSVFFGASEGMQPLFGQAYGAKEDDDLKHYYRAGQLISVIGSINTMLSAYFYSTKRSGQAIALNTVRSLVMNSLVITFLPKIFGAAIVWHTFGIYEILVLVVALILKKASERNGIIYK